MQDILKKAVKSAAAAIGIGVEDLKAFFKRGETVSYKAGDWAFHESTPRQWAGIVLDGEVEIVRGLHGSTTRVAVLKPDRRKRPAGRPAPLERRGRAPRRRDLADLPRPAG